MDLLPVALSSLALLAVPGPTNALLAASGATAGFVRTLPLIGAAIAAYLAAIASLRIGLGPLLAANPNLSRALAIAAALYILSLAHALWRRSTEPASAATPLTAGSLALTTLFNPKALVLALTVLPDGIPPLELTPWLLALGAEIALVGAAWAALGAAVSRSNRAGSPTSRPRFAERASALALCMIAAALTTRAITF